MMLTAQSGTLAEALALAAAALRSRGKIIAAVRLVATDGAVTVTCNDHNTSITATSPADVLETGQAAVDASKLAALIAGFAAASAVAIGTTETGLSVVCGLSRSRIAAIPFNTLPNVLALDDEIGCVDLSGTDLLKLLSTTFATGTEQARQYLCGIFLHDTEAGLTAVGCDGLRLCTVTVPAAAFSADRSLILPRASAETLQKIVIRTKPATLTLRRSARLVSVTAPAFVFVSRLIDAGDSGFVAYEKLIPAASAASVSISRADLVAALSRLAAVSNRNAPPLVALIWDSGRSLDVFLAREPTTGADSIAATAKGRGQIAVPLGQIVAMLAEFSGAAIDLESIEGHPLVFHGDGRMALLSRSTWNFETQQKEVAA